MNGVTMLTGSWSNDAPGGVDLTFATPVERALAKRTSIPKLHKNHGLAGSGLSTADIRLDEQQVAFFATMAHQIAPVCDALNPRM